MTTPFDIIERALASDESRARVCACINSAIRGAADLGGAGLGMPEHMVTRIVIALVAIGAAIKDGATLEQLVPDRSNKLVVGLVAPLCAHSLGIGRDEAYRIFNEWRMQLPPEQETLQ